MSFHVFLYQSFCRYIKRRAREAFSTTPEASQVGELMDRARREMDVVKRQSVVFNLYAQKHKNVMVSGNVYCCMHAYTVYSSIVLMRRN